MDHRFAVPSWAKRLADALEGDLLTDAFSRARYATDASIYQCVPQAVVVPKTAADVAAAVAVAREEGIGVTARGGGTSTAGQALGDGLVIDFSKHLNRFLFYDETARTCAVEPGISPDMLNRRLRPLRSWFPVDIGSSGQATVGGMLGNNASGLRALRYGRMSENVLAVDAVLADGSEIAFTDPGGRDDREPAFLPEPLLDLLQFAEVQEPNLMTLWGGSHAPPAGPDLSALLPGEGPRPLGRLLAGSEGTLAIATRIELKLVPRPKNQALGICSFRSLRGALACVPQIVALGPTAVELMDHVLLDFGRAERLPALEPHIQRATLSNPGAVLLVEFDEENPVENSRRLKALDDAMSLMPSQRLSLVEVMGAKAQAAVWAFRRRALERSMALKSAAQPVSFLEDCAVPLDRLPAFADALGNLMDEHGLMASLHGHAGVGCLHLRPALNMRLGEDMRRLGDLRDAILPLLRKFDGRITGGYGLGLARSGFAQQTQARAMEVIAGLKTFLDPHGVLNPGKILGSPRFDDPSLLRIATVPPSDGATALAWDAVPSNAGLFHHAEACSGMALCRKAEGFACPSYQVTRDERDSPRGRANTVRLAVADELGDGAMGSDAMLETMRLCVSCKICTSVCPRSLDIPKMKAEALAAARRRIAFSRAEDLCACLPFYTERARNWRLALRLRDLFPGLARVTGQRLGFAADRAWPAWRGRRVKLPALSEIRRRGDGLRPVALFADCFNRSFEPATLSAASRVLEAGGYRPVRFEAADADGAGQPLCCGRTLYDGGFIDEARAQASRLLRALARFAEEGVPVIGLEPACALMPRDEHRALGLGEDGPGLLLFEEFLSREREGGRLKLPLKPVESPLLVHAHCHQRAHGLAAIALDVLRLVPGLAVTEAPASCCGLNGAFGYTADTFETSLAMAELALFPAVRKAGRASLVCATGFSCRKQIRDGLGQPASHPAMFLLLSLNAQGEAGAVASGETEV